MSNGAIFCLWNVTKYRSYRRLYPGGTCAAFWLQRVRSLRSTSLRVCASTASKIPVFFSVERMWNDHGGVWRSAEGTSKTQFSSLLSNRAVKYSICHFSLQNIYPFTKRRLTVFVHCQDFQRQDDQTFNSKLEATCRLRLREETRKVVTNFFVSRFTDWLFRSDCGTNSHLLPQITWSCLEVALTHFISLILLCLLRQIQLQLVTFPWTPVLY